MHAVWNSFVLKTARSHYLFPRPFLVITSDFYLPRSPPTSYFASIIPLTINFVAIPHTILCQSLTAQRSSPPHQKSPIFPICRMPRFLASISSHYVLPKTIAQFYSRLPFGKGFRRVKESSLCRFGQGSFLLVLG